MKPIIILIYDFNFNSEDIYKIEVIFDDKIKSKVLTKTFMLKNKKTYNKTSFNPCRSNTINGIPDINGCWKGKDLSKPLSPPTLMELGQIVCCRKGQDM